MAKHLGKTPTTKKCTHVDATWARLIKAMAREGMSWSQTHTINCRGNGAIAKALKKPVISAGVAKPVGRPIAISPPVHKRLERAQDQLQRAAGRLKEVTVAMIKARARACPALAQHRSSAGTVPAQCPHSARTVPAQCPL